MLTPVVEIVPRRGWAAINVRDLWHFRELLFFLAWRDIKVRYKQTVLGVAWAIIQPVFTMVVFTLFFGRLAGVPSDGLPYPIFAFAALLPWTFFSNAVTNGGSSLVSSANLITKIYFPRLLIPAAAVAAGVVDFAISLMVLFGMMVYYKVAPTWQFGMLPALVFVLVALALAASVWTAALNVKYRDIRYALPFAIQMGMFVTPIIYPVSLVPVEWRWLLYLNPMCGIIEGFRSSLLGRPFDWMAMGSSLVITMVMLVISAFVFRRMESSFADLV
jgi:lipopolysaccharide transport system permease protein